MKVTDVLKPGAINLSLQAENKTTAIEKLVSLVARANGLPQEEQIQSRVLKRESLCSTGMGHGVALPHAQIPWLPETYVAFGRCEAGIPFDAPDGEPVCWMFLLVGPESDTKVHLLLLAKLSRLLNRESIRQALNVAKTPEEVLQALED